MSLEPISDGWFWSAAALGFAVLTAIGTHSFRLADRISKSESKARTAEEKAEAAAVHASGVESQLTQLRVEVARNYVSNDALDKVESRIIEAIKGITTRMDNMIRGKDH